MSVSPIDPMDVPESRPSPKPYLSSSWAAGSREAALFGGQKSFCAAVPAHCRDLETVFDKLEEVEVRAEHHRRISHMLWEHNQVLEDTVRRFEVEQEQVDHGVVLNDVQFLHQRLHRIESLCVEMGTVPLTQTDKSIGEKFCPQADRELIAKCFQTIDEQLCTLELAFTRMRGRLVCGETVSGQPHEAQSEQANPRSKIKRTQSQVRSSRKPVEEKLKRSTGAAHSGIHQIDWSAADFSKWTFPNMQFSGAFSVSQKPVIEAVFGPIEQGRQELRAHPEKYLGLFWQTNVSKWPNAQQSYSMVRRTSSGFVVQELPQGSFTWEQAKYAVLKKLDVSEIKPCNQAVSFANKTPLPMLLPGRGDGCADIPSLKILGDVDPSDVWQGKIGDCWLLSAISALAEFDGAILRLFRKTVDIMNMPKEGPNEYTVTLYDLSTWQPVDIVMDERLCAHRMGSAELLGCLPSVDGELWVCYLEKAVAIHCGGWDEISGGACTHAWSLLTGCRDVYEFRKGKDGQIMCIGKFNPNTQKWDELTNCPHSGNLWPMPWPSVGGGGGFDLKVSPENLFERMCQWEDRNFLMACGSDGSDDSQSSEGVVGGHAYTILECMNNVAGTDIDLIKLRNPWGRFEFRSGKWTDDGPGWQNHPEIKAACKPVKADDGVFWMEREEFFHYFSVVYLCAKDMSEFLK